MEIEKIMEGGSSAPPEWLFLLSLVDCSADW
jgi:hypothetical protein